MMQTELHAATGHLAGIYPGYDPGAYHAHALDRRNPLAGPLSCSEIKLYAQDPYAYPWASGPQPSDALTWGSLVDCLVFTPDAFGANFVFKAFPDYRTKAAREWRDEQHAAGRTIITAAQRIEADTACQW